MDNNPQSQDGANKPGIDLVSLMDSLEALYNDDYYVKTAEVIKDQFVLSNDKFFDKDGKLIEDYW